MASGRWTDIEVGVQGLVLFSGFPAQVRSFSFDRSSSMNHCPYVGVVVIVMAKGCENFADVSLCCVEYLSKCRLPACAIFVNFLPACS